MKNIDRVYELLENELGIKLQRLPEKVTFNCMMDMFTVGRQFIVFGAGASGQALHQFLDKKGCKVVAFLDNNQTLVGTKINGVPIHSIDSMGKANLRSHTILISSMHYHEIAHQLNREYGLSSFSDYYCIHNFLLEDNIMGGGYGSELEAYLVDNYTNILDVANMWFDDDSRWRYFRYIYLRLFFLTPDYIEKHLFYTETKLDTWGLTKLRECLQLPKPVGLTVGAILHDRTYDYGGENRIGLKKGDCVIDGGAWVGDSTLSFALQVTSSGKVWAFEPDSEQSINLKNTIRTVQLDDFVKVLQMGLWSSETTLNFCISEDYHGAGSYFSTEAYNAVNVISIDKFVEKEKQTVDFIKLDIEGSEFEALKGAEKTITSCWPRLAICLYHKMEDLHEIPLYLKSFGGNYRFHFKHSGLVPTDAILFAGSSPT